MLIHVSQAVLYIVLGQAPHSGQFAKRIEVTDQRHPRVDSRPVLRIEKLSRRQVSRVHTNQSRLDASPGSANADVASTGIMLLTLFCVGRSSNREEIVVGIRARRREHLNGPLK